MGLAFPGCRTEFQVEARYYDPAVGRFLSVDPVAPKPGGLFFFNRYNYAENSPVVHVDPDGRCIWDGCVAEIIVLGAIISGAIDTSVQEVDHPNQPVDKKEVAIAAVAGGVTAGSGSVLTGAVASGTITVGGAVLGQAAVNATVGAGASAANDLAHGKKVSGANALKAAAISGGASLLTSGLAAKFGDFNEASANGALNKMSAAPVNSPKGIGSAISSATKSAGVVGRAQTAAQAAASQASNAVLNAGSDRLSDKVNQNE